MSPSACLDGWMQCGLRKALNSLLEDGFHTSKMSKFCSGSLNFLSREALEYSPETFDVSKRARRAVRVIPLRIYPAACETGHLADPAMTTSKLEKQKQLASQARNDAD